jgi:nicotinate-nucleotide adenylyltransferase
MVRAAVADNPRFLVSDLEARLPVPSFTVDTLRELRREEPEWEPVDLIIGSDSLLELPTWKTPHELVKMARLIVYPREGAPAAAAPPEMLGRSLILDVPPLPVSSTAMRRRVREGRALRYWLPDDVRELVAAHGLYLTSHEG